MTWRPLLIGGVMGPMILWMLHGPLSEGRGWQAAALFLLAHLAVFGGLALAVLLVARRAPGLAGRLSRLHRPSLRHAGLMVAGAALTASITHLIHGGPAT